MKLEVAPQKTILVRSDEQLEYGVSSHDWDHLRDIVDNICVAEPIHLTIGTLFWGIAITAFFGALSLPEGIIIIGFPGRLLSWAICGIFFFSGIPCLLYAYMERDNINSSKKNVINYLDHLEEKFGDLDIDPDDD